MKGFTIIAALLGAGLASVGVANAATITYSGSLNGRSSDSYPGSNVLSGNGDISLQQFDPSLGTLNSEAFRRCRARAYVRRLASLVR